MAHERGLGSTKSSNLTTSRGISIGVSNLLGKTTDGGGGKKAGRLFGSGLLSHRGNVSSAGRGVAQSGERALRSVKTSGAGSDFVSGFRGSISSGGGSVWSAAWSLGQSALTALRRSIKTASPSKETKKTGKDFVSGYTIAIKKNTKKASAAAKKLGDNTLKNLQVKFDTKKMGTNKYISELKKVQRQYKLTSAQRRKVEKEIFRANSARKDQNKKYAKSIDQINNKYYKLNESYYKNVRKINDKLSKDIKRVKKEYNDQLKSLSQSIYNQVGLFNKVEKKSTDKNVLLNNLKEQNEQFVKFRRNISRIQKKGASKAFVNELRAMGVGSAAEIEAISKMTKAELKTYQNMWKEKKRLADLEAKRQMADEKKRMNAQIKSLRKARDKQLKQEKSEWRRGMKAINKDLRELRDFRKTGIKLGRDTVRGLTAGLRKTGSLKKTSRSLAKTIEKEIKRTLKIKSPSRLMELEVGAMVPAGVVRGIDKGLRMVKQSAHELALSAIPNFDNKTAIEQAVETARLTHGAMTNEMDKMAQNYSAASFVLKQNKEVLKVEHTLDSKFEKFMNLLVNEKVKQDNPIKELLQATLQQNQLLMQLLNKDFKAEVAFDSVYQPIKRRLNEDQYSNFKQRRR